MIKIIFCAFNEEENLEKFLSDLDLVKHGLQRDMSVVTCLDGTTDDSLHIIENHRKNLAIKVLPQVDARGLGNAYKRIFCDILPTLTDDDLVISLDADNTHNPAEIVKMLTHFERGYLDVLIASRFSQTSEMTGFPLHRKLISKTTSILLQVLFAVKKISNQNLQDYTSGYRIYRAAILKKLLAAEGKNFITEPEFTYTCELMIKLSRIGARIDEISFPYDYSQKFGESKLRFTRNLWRLVVLVVRLKLKDTM